MAVLADAVKSLKANPRFAPHQGRARARESEDCLQWGFSRFERERTHSSEYAPLDKRISSDSNWHNLDAMALMGEAYSLHQKYEWYCTSVPLEAASQPIDYLILRRKQMEIWFKQCMATAARACEECNWDGARKCFSQALQYCPTFPACPTPSSSFSPPVEVSSSAAAAYFGRAEVLAHQQLYDEAVDDYRACLRVDSSFLGAKEGLALAELQLLLPTTVDETNYGGFDPATGGQGIEGRKRGRSDAPSHLCFDTEGSTEDIDVRGQARASAQPTTKKARACEDENNKAKKERKKRKEKKERKERKKWKEK
jgi:tetratricopeptide (TPR) repeat protein